MKTRPALEPAPKRPRAPGRRLRLALAGGAMGAATTLVVLVGNAYTLDIPQITVDKGDAGPIANLASPGHAPVPTAGRSGRPVAAASGALGAHAAPTFGGPLLPAMLSSPQGVGEAAQASDDAPDADSAAAPGVLTPATSGATGFAAAPGDGGFGFGSAASGGFGPPSGSGGLLSAPGGASPPASDANTPPAAPPQGFQPLLSAPSLTGPAPEPATWALLTLGLAGVGVTLRAKHRHHAA
jgi:hypothetical protein